MGIYTKNSMCSATIQNKKKALKMISCKRNNKKDRIPAEDTTSCLLSDNYTRLSTEDQEKLRKIKIKIELHRLRVLHDDPLVRVIAEFILFILNEMEGYLHVK